VAALVLVRCRRQNGPSNTNSNTSRMTKLHSCLVGHRVVLSEDMAMDVVLDRVLAQDPTVLARGTDLDMALAQAGDTDLDMAGVCYWL